VPWILAKIDYVADMKAPLILAAILVQASQPALAQDATPGSTDEGFSLIEEGAQILLRNLMTEMQPALDDMGRLTEEIGPMVAGLTDEMGAALADLLTRIDNLRYYELPEILENGDIIIRRSPDAPEYEPPPADL
jgi:hypothetical protein